MCTYITNIISRVKRNFTTFVRLIHNSVIFDYEEEAAWLIGRKYR